MASSCIACCIFHIIPFNCSDTALGVAEATIGAKVIIFVFHHVCCFPNLAPELVPRIFGRISGAFHLVKIPGISGSAVNGTRFVGSSHWKIPRKSGKSKKVGPFSRLEFPNGISCSIYVSSSLHQFQVHGRAQRRTGVYD